MTKSDHIERLKAMAVKRDDAEQKLSDIRAEIWIEVRAGRAADIPVNQMAIALGINRVSLYKKAYAQFGKPDNRATKPKRGPKK
jgi:hypothetical protein